MCMTELVLYFRLVEEDGGINIIGTDDPVFKDQVVTIDLTALAFGVDHPFGFSITSGDAKGTEFQLFASLADSKTTTTKTTVVSKTSTTTTTTTTTNTSQQQSSLSIHTSFTVLSTGRPDNGPIDWVDVYMFYNFTVIDRILGGRTSWTSETFYVCHHRLEHNGPMVLWRSNSFSVNGYGRYENDPLYGDACIGCGLFRVGDIMTIATPGAPCGKVTTTTAKTTVVTKTSTTTTTTTTTTSTTSTASTTTALSTAGPSGTPTVDTTRAKETATPAATSTGADAGSKSNTANTPLPSTTGAAGSDPEAEQPPAVDGNSSNHSSSAAAGAPTPPPKLAVHCIVLIVLLVVTALLLLAYGWIWYTGKRDHQQQLDINPAPAAHQNPAFQVPGIYTPPHPGQPAIYDAEAASSARSVSVRQQSNVTGASVVYAIPMSTSATDPAYVDDGFYAAGAPGAPADGDYVDDGFYTSAAGAAGGAAGSAAIVYAVAVEVEDTEA